MDENRGKKRRKNDWLAAFGVILIIVGVIGFGPAGPFPVENVVVGVVIWLGLALVPTAIGGFLIWRYS